MREIADRFEKARLEIDEALDRFLPEASRKPGIIHKAMRYSVFSGGKRIRPILVMESCRACAGTNGRGLKNKMKDALAIACAVEMAHTYSLIHDDLPAMDDDDLRRGKPTCHKVFGEANAILAGDALLTLAFNVISAQVEAETSARAIKELSEAIGTFGMVGGQVLDMEHKSGSPGRKVQDEINSLKTARLFEASTKLGAIAAGALKDSAAMGRYGRAIGEAFQIVDDIMDDDGSANLSGKKRLAAMAFKATSEAKLAVKRFGVKADRLIETADMLLKRIN